MAGHYETEKTWPFTTRWVQDSDSEDKSVLGEIGRIGTGAERAVRQTLFPNQDQFNPDQLIANTNKEVAEQQQRASDSERIKGMQNQLTGEASRFSSDIPKNQRMLVGAADAATYGQAKQQERMLQSQAVAKGQAGSGIAKLRLANLSAGAKFAHVRAEADIAQKLRTQGEQMSSQSLQSSQALAGMSMDQAQKQYEIDLQNLKNQNEALGKVGGAVGYGIGSYLASPDEQQLVNQNYSGQYTMPNSYLTTQRPSSRGYLGNTDLGLGGLTNG